jgi:hypothetical protein
MDAKEAKLLVRGLIEAELSTGFPVVRRIPSPSTWKALVYVESLSRDERDALFDVFAERGCAWLQTGLEMNQFAERHKELVRHPAYARFLNEYGRAAPWKYADPSFMRDWLNIHRQYAASQATPLPPPDFGSVPLEVVEAAPPPVAAKAGEIRKAVKQAFTSRFHVKPTDLGSGVWNYPGDFEGRPFTLTLHWGTYMKMRYGLTPGHLPAHRQFHGISGVTWEGMLISGIGHWDFVCQHNLAASVALLGEIIEKTVSLHAQHCPGG